MYVLKITGSQPAIYIGVINGFIEKVETINQALQFARNSDASSMQTIVVDSTEAVSI